MARVLLADDEEDLRRMMGRQLKRSGHEVTFAGDGREAADLLASQPTGFDVIVSDMKMPRLDGMGLLAEAKRLVPDIEFIILTGHGNMENAIEAFKTGNVFDYLLKPLDDIHELSVVVGRAAERRFLRTENIRLVLELEQQIAELERAQAQLRDLAERDGLTGLLNHRTIHARLNALFPPSVTDSTTDSTVEPALDPNSSQPSKSDPESHSEPAYACLLMIDVDKFKLLNDTHGHPVGDEALRLIARALQEGSRTGETDTDMIAGIFGRCGGDEFMVVLPGCDANKGLEYSKQVRAYLTAHPLATPDGTHIPIQLCFGIADTLESGLSALSLVAAGDAALYASKGTGGNATTLSTTNPAKAGSNSSAYDTLDGLITAIDRKDRYTREHSEDMTRYALLLTEGLDLSDETSDVVRVAGLLHDIGKIGIPDSILGKPGKLTEGEYEVMKTHVTLSRLIIHGLPHLNDILDAVAHHHERWDGRGYPFGLAGENIPLLGRIMAIADAFSAMTLTRPYRVGMNVEQALQEIEKHAGTQFDPKLAKVFVHQMRARQAEVARSEANLSSQRQAA